MTSNMVNIGQSSKTETSPLSGKKIDMEIIERIKNMRSKSRENNQQHVSTISVAANNLQQLLEDSQQ
jgi:hypothetical protein